MAHLAGAARPIAEEFCLLDAIPDAECRRPPLIDRTPRGYSIVAEPLTILRLGFAAASAVAGAAYGYALWSLGRTATYCQASGLATRGVYRWTRNPQYATAIAAFAALGVAAGAWHATSLAAALVTVYALMAVAEEPWLEASYGREYLDYKAEVPRFFNIRYAWTKLSAVVTRQLPSFADSGRDKG
jgi:hypothetical protein